MSALATVHAARQPGLPVTALGAPLDAGLLAPLRLRDGRRLHLSALRARDAMAAQAFIARLSAASRYRRFHLGLPGLPPPLLRHLVDVDQDRHVALAARPPGEPGIVAEARYVLDPDDDRRAEFALAVADEWQGQGLGRLLLERLAGHARARGVRALHGGVLWDNRPMRALAERLGAQLHAAPGEVGVLQVVVDLSTVR